MTQSDSPSMDMCSGPFGKKILLFSIPLMLSNVLQVLFNLSDMAVVGHFAGAIALGSVGSTTVLITLFTGLMLGIASGVNAVTSRQLGSLNPEKAEKTVHSAFLLCLIFGVVLMVFGLFITKPVLLLLHTKKELIHGSILYLTIYLCGTPALAMFNYGNAILSASGDTRRPLVYLTISGIINVLLDLLFVIYFHMGVAGVALASIIAQYISAILVLCHLLQLKSVIRLQPKKLCLDRFINLQILHIGIPSAIQYALFAVANLFVQGAVNSFNHLVVEGNCAAVNADHIVFDMMSAFYTACTSFIAQNYGAGHKKQILKIYGITTLYSFGLGLFLGLLLSALRIPFLSMFNTDPEILYYGSVRLTIMGCSYCLSALMDNATAAARGIGKSMAPTVIAIVGSVVLRIIWIFTIFAWYRTLKSLYLLYACTWILTALTGNIYFYRCYRRLPEEHFIPKVHI